MAGLIAEKLGMTRVVTEQGAFVAATVLRVVPNRVLQVKQKPKDNADAVVVALVQEKKGKEVPLLTRQFNTAASDTFEKGQMLGVDQLSAVENLTVTATSKGKGFQGVVKRHGFGGMPETHGHRFRKAPGSIGTRKPRRTYRGRKLPGQMGNKTVTVQKIRILDIDNSKNLLVLGGAIPGFNGSFVFLTYS